jgi:hypothetical protein
LTHKFLIENYGWTLDVWTLLKMGALVALLLVCFEKILGLFV